MRLLWVALGTHSHFALIAAQGCLGSGSLSADDWSAASEFLNGTSALAVSQETWSQLWVQLARQASLDFYTNLEDCPEGTVAALVHALPALDEADGDASSLEIVKHLHHHLSVGVPVVAPPSAWQHHWLSAVASLLRFVYLKWVNVPQDPLEGKAGEGMKGPQHIPLDTSVLSHHHRLMFRTYIDEFIHSGVHDLMIAENSVLFSEAFAFMSFCRLHDVDVVLESGVYRGFSSEVWSLFAKEVIAVDLFPAVEVLQAAEERLKHRANVKVIQGNGKTLLPKLLDERPERRVAIFIDGPKGELAIRLAMRLRTYSQVAFVAMHDMAPYRGELRGHGAYFFSDEPWFQQEYGYLDDPFRRRTDLTAGGTMAFLS